MKLRYVAPLALAAAAETIALSPVALAAPTGPTNQCTSPISIGRNRFRARPTPVAAHSKPSAMPRP